MRSKKNKYAWSDCVYLHPPSQKDKKNATNQRWTVSRKIPKRKYESIFSFFSNSNETSPAFSLCDRSDSFLSSGKKRILSLYPFCTILEITDSSLPWLEGKIAYSSGGSWLEDVCISILGQVPVLRFCIIHTWNLIDRHACLAYAGSRPRFQFDFRASRSDGSKFPEITQGETVWEDYRCMEG